MDVRGKDGKLTKLTADDSQSTKNILGRTAQATTLDSGTKIDADTTKALADNIIEAGLSAQLDIGAIEDFTRISNNRDQLYQLIDTMTQDSSVASILRTYSENVCETADNGHVIWCESPDPKISKFINYVLNVMNADKNMYGWTYCLLKYGDVYLRLYRESDYKDPLFSKQHINNSYSAKNILNEEYKDEKLDESVYLNLHSINDPYSYYVEMVDDPSTMFELTKYGKTYGFLEVPNLKSDVFNNDIFSGMPNSNTYNFRLKSTDVNVYQADDFVHACLEDNFTRFPETVDLFLNQEDYKNNVNNQSYNVRRGKSILYDSYKIWREKALLENAALLNRITRSSIVRKVSVEVGDMPKEQVSKTLHRVKEMFEQKTAINVGQSYSEYNNPGPMENNIYFATHNGQGSITVDSVGGDVDVKNLADLDWWNNKFYSSYGIPKQYFGWTDDGAGFNGGTSLTILSSVYAKGVKRVQNAMIQAVTDIINLILVNKGLTSYLNNFTLKMKAPTTQEELDYRSELTNTISAISNFQSVLTDVEDKSRRLRILKDLIAPLNYGDGIIKELNDEIAENEENKKKEAEAVEAENAEKIANGEVPDAGLDLGADSESESGMEEMDLDSDENTLPDLSDLDLESFKSTEGLTNLTEEFDDEILTENQFMEDAANDKLPSPEDLADVDFSKSASKIKPED